MELRQLSTFRVVATTLSFTRAAAALDYAQSSVTAQIQALEDDLGVPLFNRLGRQVVLTDAGQRLLTYADRLLALEKEARSVVVGGGKPAGTLTIGAPESVCTYRLPPVLRRFHDWFPDVRLIFRPLMPADLHRHLSHGGVDAAFFLAEPVQSAVLVVETLICEPLLLVAASDHPLAQHGRVISADLQNEAMLLTEKGCSYRGLFERKLADDGVHPSSSVEFTSIEAIKQCVAVGMGIAVLPAMVVAKEVAQGHLRALCWEQEGFQVYTQLAWHKDRWLSPALAAFIEMSREILKAAF
jgi:DNA-binding transcriptional LysR family regulator